MKRLLYLFVILSFIAAGCSQKKGNNYIRASYKTDIHIVSGNDIHGAIENMPMLAAAVDSLRAIDKSLLVLSAGDNRTGNPLNDLYTIPAFPMVALMNYIGFDASTFGNHEFDSEQPLLSKLINLSNFPYICANVFPDAELGIQNIPYKFFDVKGVKVCILGVIQLGIQGIPDSNPDHLKGIRFEGVEETINKYLYLRDQCDVFILLSHIGYEDDCAMAEKFPQFDLIVGGHTHTQIEGGELHNGVLITQNVNKLQRVTHTILTVENGKVTGKRAENIEIASSKNKNPFVAQIVEKFSDNPELKRVLAVATAPFSTYEELGLLMCDALKEMTHSEIGFTNMGGVRYDTHPKGDFTVDDVLRLDPFGNGVVIMELTPKEIEDMLIACFYADRNRFPYTSGIKCDVEYTANAKNEPEKVVKLTLTTDDGKPLDPNKKYKVAGNAYAVTVSESPREDEGREFGSISSDLLIKFLTEKKQINYSGRRCLTEHIVK